MNFPPLNIDNKKYTVLPSQPFQVVPAGWQSYHSMVPTANPYQLCVPHLIPTLPSDAPPVVLDGSSMPILPLDVPLSLDAPPMVFDGSSFRPLPRNLQVVDGEGNWVAPPGFTLVLMNVPSESVKPSVSTGPAGEPDLIPPMSKAHSRSRSSSVVSEPEQTQEDEATVATIPQTAKLQNKKYPHRSKQKRIMEVYAKLKEEYTAKGLYASDDEVLRGFDTVRVHVKTFKAVNRIGCPLNDVEKHPRVKILKIATPFSMKNKFQKKGFIVYLKLAHVDMVEIVQEIFSHYKEHFPKCDVALKKEDKLALDRQRDLSSRTSSTEFLSQVSYRSQGMDLTNWANLAA